MKVSKSLPHLLVVDVHGREGRGVAPELSVSFMMRDRLLVLCVGQAEECGGTVARGTVAEEEEEAGSNLSSGTQGSN